MASIVHWASLPKVTLLRGQSRPSEPIHGMAWRQMFCSLGSHGTSHGTALSEEEQAWRNWPLARREREYSPSSCIASSAPFLAAYEARSREAELRLRCQKNLRLGEAADETFDFFAADSADAPLLLFIHGGYWQELSKNESLFAAPDCVANGIAFAALDYTLAPRATLGAIVEQCLRAIASLAPQSPTLGFDARRIYCAGHFSA